MCVLGEVGVRLKLRECVQEIMDHQDSARWTSGFTSLSIRPLVSSFSSIPSFPHLHDVGVVLRMTDGADGGGND